jgi:hypothetical protein
MAQPSGRDRLAGLLGDVRAATAFRYDARDSLGNRMDTAKVIVSPAGGYLAVTTAAKPATWLPPST